MSYFCRIRQKNKWYIYIFFRAHSQIYLLINDNGHTVALYSTVKCDGVGFPLAHIPTDELYSIYIHHRTLQYCKVRWCWLYHLLVGIYENDLLVSICENGYPLAHIPTDKWYSGYTIALYSTVKCDGVGCIVYQ